MAATQITSVAATKLAAKVKARQHQSGHLQMALAVKKVARAWRRLVAMRKYSGQVDSILIIQKEVGHCHCHVVLLTSMAAVAPLEPPHCVSGSSGGGSNSAAAMAHVA